MFWWYYKSPYRTQDSNNPWPIILWLQGGPVSTCVHDFIQMWKVKTCFVFQKCVFDLCMCFSGCFRSWNWKLWRGGPIRLFLEAKKLYMAKKGRSIVCGKQLWYIFLNYCFVFFNIVYILFLWEIRIIQLGLDTVLLKIESYWWKLMKRLQLI